MANRYWVGGTGNWSDNTNHWSASSGGSAGASLPTSSDDVFINPSSGFGSGGTISLDTSLNTASCKSFTASSGHNWTLTSVTDNIKIYGSLTLESSMSLSGQLFFNCVSTSTGNTITLAGVDNDGGINFNSATGGWTIQDDINTPSGGIDQYSGSLDVNSKTINCLHFTSQLSIGGTVVFGSSNIYCSGSGCYFGIIKGLGSVDASLLNVYITGGSDLPSGAESLDVRGNFTLNSATLYTSMYLGNCYDVTIETLNLTPGKIYWMPLNKTLYINNLNGGSINNNITLFSQDTYFDLDSTTGTFQFGETVQNGLGGSGIVVDTDGSSYIGLRNVSGVLNDGDTLTGLTSSATSPISNKFEDLGSWTISKPSGILSTNYLNLSDSIATGGATFYAGSFSIDYLNNTGWIFSDIPPEELTVNINGIDRTLDIETNSLKISNILTRKRDSCDFSIITHQGDSYSPSIGNNIIISDDSGKIFGGIIVSIDDSPLAYGMVRHSISCQDYTRLLDQKLVLQVYKDQTVNEIIADLKTQYFPAGITINNVDADVNIDYVAFNYLPVGKCIEQLAETLNYDWYLDYDKDLHFFAKESIVSPFDLTDDNGKYDYNSLIIRKDNSQIRNSIIVRGGDYLAAQTTFDIQTNGVDSVYPLPYKFTDFDASLTGTNLHIGIDNINDPNNYDALYNFQEKIIRFKTEDKPSASKTLKVSGKPNLPVIVQYRSPQHILAMASVEGGDGEYQYLIKDPTINSKEGARQRARAEIEAYAQTLSEGEFITYTSGLKAGQMINIQSSTRGFNENYIINRVDFSQFGKDTFAYRVSLITTRTFDLIDILQRLLLQSNKDINISQNEVLESIQNLDDSMSTNDSVNVSSTTTADYKWGHFRWGFARWS